MADNQLDSTWQEQLQDELNASYMQELKRFIIERRNQGATIFPPPQQWFNALYLTPFDAVKVVIIGQDPYHGPKQAHGLSFSVQKGIEIPPSLRNIFIELENDLSNSDLNSPKTTNTLKAGDLSAWAKQGVLLLNTILTVEQAKPSSHANKGWERFTDKIITLLSEKRKNLVFILWGSYAQQKVTIIDGHKHLLIKSPHPSPLSAHRGFFGSKPFSTANNYLVANNSKPIDWEAFT